MPPFPAHISVTFASFYHHSDATGEGKESGLFCRWPFVVSISVLLVSSPVTLNIAGRCFTV